MDNINEKIPIHLLTNTQGLMKILSCGKPTAIKIGQEAQAKICIGRKILWNIDKVRQYLNEIAE